MHRLIIPSTKEDSFISPGWIIQKRIASHVMGMISAEGHPGYPASVAMGKFGES
jgi:hypothetical protein